MKAIKLSLILLVATLCSCSQVEYDMFADLTVQVVDASTDDALEGVAILLSPSGKNAYTGSDGTYTFESLEAIQYTIMAQKEGYQTNRKSIIVVAGEQNVAYITMSRTK